VIGYHLVSERDLQSVLERGLLRGGTPSLGCPEKHICIAETPELAATMCPRGELGQYCVLLVNLDGLEGVSEYVGLEARVHNDIPPDRITIYDGPMGRPTEAGWIDPGATREGLHPSCIARRAAA
jgi:hypothetical protein